MIPLLLLLALVWFLTSVLPELIEILHHAGEHLASSLRWLWPALEWIGIGFLIVLGGCWGVRAIAGALTLGK